VELYRGKSVLILKLTLLVFHPRYRNASWHHVVHFCLTTFYKGESQDTNGLLTIDHLGLLSLALGFSLEQCTRDGFALVILNPRFKHFSEIFL